MFRNFAACALIVAIPAIASFQSHADGALAVGSTSNVTKDGIAFGTAINYKSTSEAGSIALKYCRDYKPAPKAAVQCQLIATFKTECYAISMDPKAGTPGAGWAIAATKTSAEERALAACKATAGSGRREYCKVQEAKCDGDSN